MLVHLPLACWLLAPASDAAALMLGGEFFWQVAALLSATGVVVGAIAAMFGTLELERLKDRKDLQKIATIHASLMGAVWTLGVIALVGRLGEGFLAAIPAPMWVVVLDFLAAGLLLAGAFFGGEMVYGHGVGVKRQDKP